MEETPVSLMVSTTQETRPLGSVSTVYRKVVQDWRALSATVPCDGCTACCRAGYAIELTADEATHIPHVRDGRRLLIPRKTDGSCSLLQDNRCTIYAQRPRVCRAYDCRMFSLSTFFPSRLLQVEDFRPFRLDTSRREDAEMEAALRMAALSALQTAQDAEVVAPLALASVPRFLPIAQQMMAMIEQDTTLRDTLVQYIHRLTDAVRAGGGRLDIPLPVLPGRTAQTSSQRVTRRDFLRRTRQRTLTDTEDTPPCLTP